MLPALVVLTVVAVILAVLLVSARRSVATARTTVRAVEERLAAAEATGEQASAARDEAVAQVERVTSDRDAAVAAAEAKAAEDRARLAQAEEATEAAWASRDAAERARQEAEATVSETATLAARLIDDGSADPAALWALERLRIERIWRHSVSPVGGASPLVGTAEPLRVALEIEVAAVREEVGAVIDLAVDLREPLTPGASLATFRAAQELVAAAAKKGEVTSVSVTAEGTDVVVRVESFDAAGAPLAPTPLRLPPSRLEPDGSTVRLRDALSS